MTTNIRTRIAVLAGALLTTVAMATMTTEASAATPVANAASHHQIVNLAYNQCVDAPNGTLNVRLKLADCSGSATQEWAFVATPTAGTYYLVNEASGYCAEVNNGTSTPGEAVDEYFCGGTASEQWVQSLRVVNAIVYQQFTHQGTTMCLDTVSGRGSQLMQWYCDSANDAQTWLVR